MSEDGTDNYILIRYFVNHVRLTIVAMETQPEEITYEIMISMFRVISATDDNN